MNVTYVPFVDRFSDSSDLEEKLVTSSLLGMSIRPTCLPDGVISSRKMGEVMPKLASVSTLLKICGKEPSAVAVTQFPAVQPGGSWVVPATSSGSGTKVLPLTSRSPGEIADLPGHGLAFGLALAAPAAAAAAAPVMQSPAASTAIPVRARMGPSSLIFWITPDIQAISAGEQVSCGWTAGVAWPSIGNGVIREQ